MKKNHHQLIAESYKNALSASQDLANRLSENVSKVIVWLIGFSIGSLAFVLTNSDRLAFLNDSTKKYVVVFLTASILSGIFGRIIYLISEFLALRLSLVLDIMLDKYLHPIHIRELHGDETAEMVSHFFREDFPEQTQEEYNLFDEFAKKQEHEKARELYKEMAQWSAGEYELAIEDISQVIKTVYSVKEKDVPQNYFGKYGIWMRRCLRLSLVLYVMSFLLFGVTFFVLAKSFLA
ncbi:MAG: hypothetical protein E6H07_18290 [Bacteroidetes bacterium]|nr:MAG: hypothetical protein E6H07_18290 [Bacteroidota bacterium]